MNTLKGNIIQVESSDNISIVQVEVGGDIFSSLVLEGRAGPSNYRINDQVTLLFKETEVGIAKNLSGLISFRNRFKSVIKKIDQGQILTKITLDYKNVAIESIISTKSAKQLALRENDDVEWLVKSNEVTLMRKLP